MAGLPNPAPDSLDEPRAPRAAGPKTRGGGSSIQAWIAQHRSEALGAVAVVVIYALYKRNKATAAAAAGAPTGTTTGTYAGLPTVGYDSTNLDQYGQLAGAISSANDAIDALQAQSSSQALNDAAQTLPKQQKFGSGYGPTPYGTIVPIQTANGTFDQVDANPNDNQAGALAAEGVPLYWQPFPGTFTPVPPRTGLLAAATPIFVKQGQGPQTP